MLLVFCFSGENQLFWPLDGTEFAHSKQTQPCWSVSQVMQTPLFWTPPMSPLTTVTHYLNVRHTLCHHRGLLGIQTSSLVQSRSIQIRIRTSNRIPKRCMGTFKFEKLQALAFFKKQKQNKKQSSM